MRRPLALLSVVSAVLLLAGCHEEEQVDVCGLDAEKLGIASLLYDWYLYPDLLPAVVDTSQYASSAALIEAMTRPARDLGLDRGWTFVTTATESQSFFEEGTSVGFGLGLLERDARVLVSQVYPDSAAADAGLARGDEIRRIGETAETLAVVTPETLGAALGPAEAGVTRVFELIPAGSAAPVVTPPVTKRLFDLDPVPSVGPAGERFKIVERNGRRVGYVALRTFVRTADAPLVQAFEAFHDAGVSEVVVDLRYNGGGLVSTSDLLANLLGGGISGTMLRLTHNVRHAAADVTTTFAPPAGAVTAARIAFITSGASASASELVPNVLEPYRQVALVGAKTFGKPVGQRGFQRRGCEWVAFVVAFRLENTQGDGSYYGGLPDAPATGDPAFSGPLCAAEDDLSRSPGDEAEASTAAALAFLETGSCPAPPAPPAAKLGLAATRGPDRYPAAHEPSLAQRHVSGLF